MNLPFFRLEDKVSNTMIVDLVLIVSGIYFTLNFGSEKAISEISPAMMLTMFLVVVSVIPWYMGYLFQYFESYPKSFQLVIKWFFGIITLGLVVFLVLTFIPITEKEASGIETFLTAFGMFFLVLGPMMLFAGYADGRSIDSSRDPSQPYIKPIVTFVMLVITLAVLYMILFIGLFDPKWEGSANFLVIVLAFLVGPLSAILTLLPFVLVVNQVQKIDVHRLFPKLIYFILPFVTFQSLIWWNDIVLFDLKGLWEGGHPTAGQIVWSMILTGIIPFRVIMLLKPPFKWTGLFFGLIAIGIYVVGVLKEYGAW